MHNNSISIPVSDSDSDDPSGRTWVRVRRKRKKPGPRGKTDLTRWVITKLLKWWPVLLFFLAAVLLTYEASKIAGGKPPSSRVKMATRNGDKPQGNLNRLDPTTHVVGGVRERNIVSGLMGIEVVEKAQGLISRSSVSIYILQKGHPHGFSKKETIGCLKLLPPEELEHLVIPMDKESGNPMKKMAYMTESNTPVLEGNFNLSRQHFVGTRFNLFTGYQTLEQRKQSFKATETAGIHCGFYSEKGGFRISDEDKSYMQTCKIVVSTCAFGGGDDLYQPIGMSETSLQKVCYVAFWDDITLATQEEQVHKVGENHFMGKWRIVIVKDLPFTDQRLNGKIPKMLAHRLFVNSRYSIWVDSKSQFRRDPLGVLEALLWRSNFELAISEHGARSSVYDEAKAVVKKNKATPEEVEIQIKQYHADGLPEDKRFNGKKALAEASIIVRKHTPTTNLFMCLWFNEVVRFTSRDQLSFPYVLWRLKGLRNINMFPVCTRKDLVNSMGHIRKAKPLVN